jgi:Fic family protein
MASPHVKLSNSMAILKAIQDRAGPIIELAEHPALTPVHRKRLQDQGIIAQVIPGWYVANHMNEPAGSSTFWYVHMDQFVAAYANSRFGNRWQMSPEISVLRHSGESGAIKQLVLHSPAASNQVLPLPHGCSLLMYKVKDTTLGADAVTTDAGLRLLPLEEALIALSPQFFVSQPLAAQIALRSVDATELARKLLEGDHTTIAGRLAAALKAVGRGEEAGELVAAMKAAGHRVVLSNPFDHELPAYDWKEAESPHVQRVRAMWAQMRPVVIDAFRDVPRVSTANVPAFLKDIEDRYVADAYHSLSIEGFKVTDELIRKVRAGTWNPDGDAADKEMQGAMNARGYYELHHHVLSLIERVLSKDEPVGELFRKDFTSWYRTMYGPCVQAGLVPAAALAGYRNHPIYIRNARHVPPAAEWVRQCMPVFLELMQQEEDAAVRAVLGHFIFVYIHPYRDGNGRISRFIMNLMLTTAGYRWTIVTVESRDEYMAALDRASGDKDISAFAAFLARLAREQHATPVVRGGPR